MSRTVETEKMDVLIRLVAAKKYNEGIECAHELLRRIEQLDKRELDSVAAKAYFYLSICFERTKQLDKSIAYVSCRLRTVTLRRQHASQAVLVNNLLRTMLLAGRVKAVATLVTKLAFPENANNNEYARYYYYRGRIEAAKLDYAKAAYYLLHAMRKAPQDSAVGFKQNVQKWAVVISLLQGEIPERSIFRQPIFRRPLAPYFQLTKAVRLGDIAMFNDTLKKYGPTVFEKDKTMTSIVRLRQNVIKTAVRQISTAYSCISIDDIRKKLLLKTSDETEYIVAKAIKEGAIEAKLRLDGPKKRFMESVEPSDLYSTNEPQFILDARIRCCLELYNSAVKALRYPPKSYIDQVESIEEQRKREQQELEFAQNMAEEDGDEEPF